MNRSKIYLLPWRTGSRSAKAIAQGFGVRRIRWHNSRFKGSPEKTVINWGSSRTPPQVNQACVINHSYYVRSCVDKLEFFQKFSEGDDAPRLIEYTSSLKEALKWHMDGTMVFARTDVSGHSGSGIVILSDENISELKDCTLFTKYFKKKHEFRIHIMNGEVIFKQQKKLRNDLIGTGKDKFYIRNYDSGFVFANQDIDVPEDVITQAMKAYKKSKLHFCAVDILYNEYYKQARVCEINTAPGVEGSCLTAYIEGFKKHLEEMTIEPVEEQEEQEDQYDEELLDNLFDEQDLPFFGRR